jgi:hypothetical protein
MTHEVITHVNDVFVRQHKAYLLWDNLLRGGTETDSKHMIPVRGQRSENISSRLLYALKPNPTTPHPGYLFLA